MIKKHIPNSITLLNLLSGALAIIYTLHEGKVEMAVYLIILAAVFDFFDGLVARALGVSSPIGKDLDSLADVISFGLAPAVVMVYSLWQSGVSFGLGLFPLLIAAFAALRLAKFNNDTRQTTSFLGTPVPSNALFWIGLQAIVPQMQLMLGQQTMLFIIYGLVLLFCFLMVSELPMFSFKLQKGQSVLPQVALVVISAGAIILLGIFGCAIAIVAYILLSLLCNIRRN